MRLVPIVDCMKAAKLGRVYGALEFAGLKTAPAQLPARFVVPEGWDATPNNRIGVHDQSLSETFGVIHMLQAAALNQAAIADDLEAEERRTIDALVGWTHPDASRACEAVRGRLLSVDGHTLNWMTTFRTGRHIRKEASA